MLGRWSVRAGADYERQRLDTKAFSVLPLSLINITFYMYQYFHSNHKQSLHLFAIFRSINLRISNRCLYLFCTLPQDRPIQVPR